MKSGMRNSDIYKVAERSDDTGGKFMLKNKENDSLGGMDPNLPKVKKLSYLLCIGK